MSKAAISVDVFKSTISNKSNNAEKCVQSANLCSRKCIEPPSRQFGGITTEGRFGKVTSCHSEENAKQEKQFEIKEIDLFGFDEEIEVEEIRQNRSSSYCKWVFGKWVVSDIKSSSEFRFIFLSYRAIDAFRGLLRQCCDEGRMIHANELLEYSEPHGNELTHRPVNYSRFFS